MMNDDPALTYHETGSQPKVQNPLDIRSVRLCRKCVTLGTKHVPSSGNPQAEIMIIGQSPGKTEVELGRPFTGSCGDLLDYMLDQAKVDRDDIYIANALKCRPPGNRQGNPSELNHCFQTWLLPEINVVNPRIIVLLGKDAHTIVLPPKFPFKHDAVTRGQRRVYLTSYHPGYFIRNKSRMEEFISVGNTLRELLDE